MTAKTGDLKEALRYLKDSLRMMQSLHGDIDHPEIAATLARLGHVTALTGDLKEGLWYLKDGLRMQLSWLGLSSFGQLCFFMSFFMVAFVTGRILPARAGGIILVASIWWLSR